MPSIFSDYIPGKWSSHPDALKRQRVWLFLAGLAPILVLLALGFVVFTDFDSWKALVLNPMRWVRVVATAFCVSLGAIFTLTMLNMVARTLGRSDGMKGRDELPFPAWIVVVGIFFWVAPMGLMFFRERFFDPAYAGVVQFILNILCFAPFILILLWVLLAKNAEELKDRNRRSKLLGILWGLLLGLAILSLLGDVHASLSHWHVSAAWIQGIHRTMLRLILFATLFPLAIIFFALWKLIRLKPKVKKTRKEEIPSEEQKDDEVVAGPPAWLKELCSHLPDGVRVEGDAPVRVSLPDVSPFHEGADGGWLLLSGGKTPTEDQWQFLQRFSMAYRDSLEKALDHGEPQALPTRADILLQGMPGSGRTEALCAAALFTALVRGQYVLFIVSDNQQAKILQARLDGRLRDMLLGSYVECAVLTKTLAGGWFNDPPSSSIANILFATPENIETSFFSNSTTIEPEKLKRLRAALLFFEVVLVDDFMEFNVTERSHLAFILDKLRLLLISERVVPQFVVAVPRLQAPEGVEQLGERLFGLRNFDRNDNVILLRPRPCEPFWELNLRVSTAEPNESAARMKKVCRDLVVRCRNELKLNVLFYQKGINENARKDLEKELGGQTDGGRLRVISKLDDADDGRDSPDAVFYLSLVAGNLSVALRLATGDGKAVYVRIAAEGEQDIGDDVEKIVLIPDESAYSLRMAHLRSVLAFLDPLTPVDASIWSLFGISMTHPQIREESAIATGAPVALISWLHDEWMEQDRYPLGQLWPYLVLEQGTTANVRGQPVNFRVFPQSREAVFKAKEGSRLFLGRLSEDKKIVGGRQLAVWKDKKGNRDTLELEMDLAHADELILKTDNDIYSSASIEVSGQADMARFAISITAKYNCGDGSDYDIPIRSFSWQACSSFRAEDVWQLDNVAGFMLTHRNGEFCHVEGSLDASLNFFGETRKNTPCPYAYPAHLSGILLAPELPDGSDGSPTIRACLNGRWETRGQSGFSPVLTHAITASLRHRFEGWSFFALAPVFMISGRQGSVGQAVIWLLEPVNSGRTVYPMFKALLQKNEFRKEFFRDVRKNLECISNLADMRKNSRLAFTGEVHNPDDVNIARQMLDGMEQGTSGASNTSDAGEKATEHELLPAVKRIYSDQYSEEEREFDAVVVKGLLAFQDSIDVTKFAVEYRWSNERICETLNDVLWNNPQIFYVSKSHKYQWWSDAAGNVKRFLLLDFLYAIQKEQYAEKKAEIDREAGKAMAAVGQATDPVHKALALHDYLVKTCEYDRDAADADDTSPLARTAYSALVRHKAVCEGYAMGYRYLLNLAGIQSEELLSQEMEHCWNYVKLGADWYHVDVTHDDPVYLGRKPDKQIISRDYFLLSDTAIQSKKHCGWELRGLPPASNSQYDEKNWT